MRLNWHKKIVKKIKWPNQCLKVSKFYKALGRKKIEMEVFENEKSNIKGKTS